MSLNTNDIITNSADLTLPIASIEVFDPPRNRKERRRTHRKMRLSIPKRHRQTWGVTR